MLIVDLCAAGKDIFPFEYSLSNLTSALSMFSLVGPPHVPTQDVVSQNSNCKLITQGNYHFNTATHTNLALVHCILLHPRTALSPYPFWDHVSNGKYLLP